jgi:hypothetical protein
MKKLKLLQRVKSLTALYAQTPKPWELKGFNICHIATYIAYIALYSFFVLILPIT